MTQARLSQMHLAIIIEENEHFINKYDLDEDLQNVLDAVNEITISKALVQIDMKYNFLDRHFIAASN